MDRHVFGRAAFCGLLLLSTVSLARADFYYVKDLGTLGGNQSQAYGLNNLGQVVGFSFTSNNVASHAVLFSGTGSNNIDLDVRGGNATISEAVAINDSGQIVGEGVPASGGRVEAILYKDSTNINLGDLSDCGGTAGSADAINNSGAIVGFGDDCFFDAEPCLFSGTGTGNTALSGIGGGITGIAYAINASGQIAGYGTRSSDQAQHAAFFSGANSVDLGTLGGFNSHAYGINDAGQIVGDSALPGNSIIHAVLFSGTGNNNIDLGSLGGANCHAYAINNSGEIVGNSYPATNNNSVYHAFIYKNGVMQDLNGLVLTNSGFHNIRLIEDGSRVPARVINDSGQIAAIGDGIVGTHAILLTPVLRRLSLAHSGNNIVINFDAVSGKTYRLEQSASLTNPVWQSVPGVADFVAVTTGPAQFTDTNGFNSGKPFYRVHLL